MSTIGKIAKLFVFLAVMMVLSPYSIAFAESYNLPEIMTSDGLTVTKDGGTNILYGGYTGNEAVLNFNPNTSSDPVSSVGFLHDWLNGVAANGGTVVGNCYDSLSNPRVCFQSPFGAHAPYDIMSSKTSVNSIIGNETAALVYARNTAEGDVYGDGNALNNKVLDNFALYGRNLNLNSGATGGTWNLPQGYALNTQAQASYDSSATADYKARISQLANEAQTVEAPVLTRSINWYLQHLSITDSSTVPPNDETNRYPEGKIWLVQVGGANGDITIPDDTTIYYHGIGTIVIRGNLIIGKNVNIQPAVDGVNELGFIISK